jgi:hypothetical protein
MDFHRVAIGLRSKLVDSYLPASPENVSIPFVSAFNIEPLTITRTMRSRRFRTSVIRRDKLIDHEEWIGNGERINNKEQISDLSQPITKSLDARTIFTLTDSKPNPLSLRTKNNPTLVGKADPSKRFRHAEHFPREGDTFVNVQFIESRDMPR